MKFHLSSKVNCKVFFTENLEALLSEKGKRNTLLLFLLHLPINVKWFENVVVKFKCIFISYFNLLYVQDGVHRFKCLLYFSRKRRKYFAEMVTIHINKEWGNER